MPALHHPFEFALERSASDRTRQGRSLTWIARSLKSGAKIHEIVAENSPFRIIRPSVMRIFAPDEKAPRMRDAKGWILFHVKYIRPKAP
ncbi:hypothetical protein [Rhizobium fabae]|uniref:Uncharacterized protein n=1 Tax=Rhizobium fabae TaxID=573179 RepID=A0A7W6FLQ9_9HYPH|nr:hypothetical protein [Rhizobium fabae]MBB3918500.1 hypothetical protein [Rhizobium fabae]